MAKTTPDPIILSEAERIRPASANPSVACCCEAWLRIFHEGLAKGQDWPMAAHDAGKAYRIAMPPLAGHENICDFIACTVHGMLIGAITGNDGTKLLYGAQIALGSVPRPSASPKPAE